MYSGEDSLEQCENKIYYLCYRFNQFIFLYEGIRDFPWLLQNISIVVFMQCKEYLKVNKKALAL